MHTTVWYTVYLYAKEGLFLPYWSKVVRCSSTPNIIKMRWNHFQEYLKLLLKVEIKRANKKRKKKNKNWLIFSTNRLQHIKCYLFVYEFWCCCCCCKLCNMQIVHKYIYLVFGWGFSLETIIDFIDWPNCIFFLISCVCV